MKLFGMDLRRPETRAANIENPTVPVSADNFLAFFGIEGTHLPAVTVDSALTVPTVAAVVGFLSRSLAALPLQAFRKSSDGPVKIDGGLQTLIHEAPNPEWTSFDWRVYMWQQVFTGGRGLSWIERSGSNIVAIWPMEPRSTTIQLVNGRRWYRFHGRPDPYPAADVIDVPFMLKANQCHHYSPITDLGAKAIQLAIAMGDYASNFFAGGGVPPLALEGPLPQGDDAFKRAMADIKRAVERARETSSPIFGMPPGHKLTQVGFDPDKGQMTEARRFQVVEVVRPYGLPPVFVQDLTTGTFNNVEQQDLHLVKHNLGQWAEKFEQQLNLKLFGQRNGNRFVKHNLDGVLRGDLKTRIEALAKGVQTALITPDEGRALDNRASMPGGDRLYIQGATVPLEKAGTIVVPPTSPDDGGANDKD